MAIHSSILAWRIPWTQEPGGLQPRWLQRVRHDLATNTFTLSDLSKQRNKDRNHKKKSEFKDIYFYLTNIPEHLL